MKNKILTGIALLLPLSFSMAKESTTSQICLSKPETEIAQCLADEEIYGHNSQHNFYLQSKDIICGIETSEKPPIYRNVKLQQITNSLAKVIKSYDCRFETDCANINIDTDGEDGIYLNSEEKYIDSYISICDGKLTFSTWDGDDGSQCNTNTVLQKEILSIDKKNMHIKENPWLKACLNNSKE